MMFTPTLKQSAYIALLLALAMTFAMSGGFIGAQQPSSAIAVEAVEPHSIHSQKNCMTTHYSSPSQLYSSMQSCFSGHFQCAAIPVNLTTRRPEGTTVFSVTEATYSSPFSPIGIRPPIV